MSDPGISGVKAGLKAVLQSVPDIGSVYTYWPRDQKGRNNICIMMDRTHEEKVSYGNPGKRHIHYTVNLYIQSIDPNPDESASEKQFDDFLDAVDVAIRGNKDLNGAVLQSGWRFIDTTNFLPQLAGQGLAIMMRAIKIFDVTVEILG